MASPTPAVGQNPTSGVCDDKDESPFIGSSTLPVGIRTWCEVELLSPYLQRFKANGDTILIGSAKHCDLVIDDPAVANVHLMIRMASDHSAGTLINLCGRPMWIGKKRIDPHNSASVRHGQSIVLSKNFNSSSDVKVRFLLVDPKRRDKGNGEIHKGAVAKALDGVQELVQCMVCQDILFNAVTVSPCQHNFCSTCLSRWAQSRNRGADKCPMCRTKMTAATANPIMRQVVQLFQVAKPDQKRSDDELKELNAADTSVLATIGRGRHHQRSGSGPTAARWSAANDDDAEVSDDEFPDWDNDDDMSSMIDDESDDSYSSDASISMELHELVMAEFHAPRRAPSLSRPTDDPTRRELSMYSSRRISNLLGSEIQEFMDSVDLDNRVGEIWTAFVAEFIGAHDGRSVEYIAMPDACIGPSAASLLGQALALKHDSVVENEDDAEYDDMPARPIRELSCDINELGNEGVDMLLRPFVAHPQCRLEKLSLAYNMIDCQGVESIVGHLKACSTLEVLNLSGNFIQDTGFAAIASSLQQNELSIESLFLDTNRATSAGLSLIADSLASNTHLRELSLSVIPGENSMAGIKFGESLVQNKSMIGLNIRGCGLGAAGVGAICKAAAKSTFMKYLFLDYNSAGDSCGDAVAELMSSNRQLRLLTLRANKFTDEVASQLAGSMSDRPAPDAADRFFSRTLPSRLPGLYDTAQTSTVQSAFDMARDAVNSALSMSAARQRERKQAAIEGLESKNENEGDSGSRTPPKPPIDDEEDEDTSSDASSAIDGFDEDIPEEGLLVDLSFNDFTTSGRQTIMAAFNSGSQQREDGQNIVRCFPKVLAELPAPLESETS